MTKRWIEHPPVACGKIPHATRGDAERQLADLVKLPYTHNKKKLHVYRCGICGSWHCGHRPGSNRHRMGKYK